MDEGT
jgi:hypothetical protein